MYDSTPPSGLSWGATVASGGPTVTLSKSKLRPWYRRVASRLALFPLLTLPWVGNASAISIGPELAPAARAVERAAERQALEKSLSQESQGKETSGTPSAERTPLAPADTLKTTQSDQTTDQTSLILEVDSKGNPALTDQNGNVLPFERVGALQAQGREHPPRLQVADSALDHPELLQGFADQGFSLFTGDLPIRLWKDRSDSVEVIVQYSDNLSMPGSVFLQVYKLADIDARQFRSRTRVILFSDYRDLSHIASYRQATTLPIFVPHSAAEAFEYVAAHRQSLFVLAGHSENGHFLVRDARGDAMFAVSAESITRAIRQSSGASLSLSCSIACEAAVSGTMKTITAKDVIESLSRDLFNNSEPDLMSFLDNFATRLNSPLILRRDVSEGVHLVLEKDDTRAYFRPTLGVEIKFDIPTSSASNLKPTIISADSLSDQYQRLSQKQERKELYYVIGFTIIFYPALVWGVVLAVCAFYLTSPVAFMERIYRLCGYDTEAPLYNETGRFLTSKVGILTIGAYATSWCAAWCILVFFGVFGIATMAIEGLAGLFGLAMLSQIFLEQEQRAIPADVVSLFEFIKDGVATTLVWMTPSSVIFTVTAVTHLNGDAILNFDGASSLAWIGIRVGFMLAVLSIILKVLHKGFDLKKIYIAGFKLPWHLMRDFDKRRFNRLKVSRW